MNDPRTINQAIVEDLYAEALMLADDARAAFNLREMAPDDSDNAMRIALSIEGLRTTTRVMHMLAWLLNQRAYYSGELTERQLRRHGNLPEERPSDPGQLAHLEPETRALIGQTEALYRRVTRLDRDWREGTLETDGPVQRLQGQIAEAFAIG